MYDPNQGNWQRHSHGVTDVEELERQVADRVPALRHWIATFDAGKLLEPDDMRAIRALLAPTAV